MHTLTEQEMSLAEDRQVFLFGVADDFCVQPHAYCCEDFKDFAAVVSLPDTALPEILSLPSRLTDDEKSLLQTTGIFEGEVLIGEIALQFTIRKVLMDLSSPLGMWDVPPAYQVLIGLS